MTTSFFLHAVKNGDSETVRSLLVDNRDLMYSRERVSGDTAAVLAIKNNHIGVLQTLVDMRAALYYNEGGYIRRPGRRSGGLPRGAVWHGWVEDSFHSCVLLAIFVTRLRNAEAVDVLFRRVCDRLIGITVHKLVENTGDLDILQFLVSIYGNEVLQSISPGGDNLLVTAIERGNKDVYKWRSTI
jgi:hypothetical protein